MSQPRLLNNFSWSSSREGTFNECKKKYWYTYYGSWDGWPLYYNDPRGNQIDPLSEYIYMLKNMQPIVVYVGSVVHKTIEKVLGTMKTKAMKELPPLDAIIKEGEKLFLKGVDESLKSAWKKHPKKHTNLLEHFYNTQISPTYIEESVAKVKTCLESWYTSPCVTNIILNPRAEWGEIERAMHFSVEDGVDAIVVFDFYLSWKRTKENSDSILMIFDWKTGQENQKIEDQLYAYALSAKKLLNASYSSMILVPFYLLEGPHGYRKVGTGQLDTIDEEKIVTIEKRIISSSREMLKLHETRLDDKGASLKPNPKYFPYTEQKGKCKRCPFLAMCEKANYEELSESELRQKVTMSR